MTETMSHHHPAVHQFQFQFPSQAPMVPMAVLLLSLCSSKPRLPVFTCLSLQSQGAEICPVSFPLLKIQKQLSIFKSVQLFTCC